jgi:hypothetical protein
MLRGVAGLAVAATILAVASAAWASDVEVALLGEMVPWPMQCAGITGDSLDFLGEGPMEEIGWSGGVKPVRYALLPLGNASDPGITVVEFAQPGGPPLLLLDADNDESLDNDSWLLPDVRNGPRSYTWFITVTVEYGEVGTVSRLPYRISVYGEYAYESQAYAYHYGGYCHRRGLVTIGGEKHVMAVVSLGSTGCYDDLGSLVTAVDLDYDGELDTLPYSHEIFGPGAPIVLPTGTYAIVWASPDGQEFHLQREGDGGARPSIARGEPALAFEARTVDGLDISVPARDGRITVLVFVRRVTASDCVTCSTSSLLSRERVDDIRAALYGLAEEIALVVIVEEMPPDGFHFEDGFRISVDVVCDPAVNNLYRRSVGAFVIDADGMIVAMDETWIVSPDLFGRPKGAYQELRGFEIRDVVDSLLQS